MSESEKALLESLGFTGWTVAGRRPATRKATGTDERGNAATGEEDVPGSVVWVITDGKGNTREMTVRADPNSTQGQPNYPWAVIEPPKDAPGAATAAAPRNAQTWTDPATGALFERQDDGTWTEKIAGAKPPPAEPASRVAKGTKRIRESGNRLLLEETVDDAGTWSLLESKPIEAPAGEIPTATVGGSLYERGPDGWKVAIQGPAAPAPKRQTQLVDDGNGGRILIDQETGDTIKTFPRGTTYETIGGALVAISPDGTFTEVYRPPREQQPDAPAPQGEFVQRYDPATGTYSTVPNAAYTPPLSDDPVQRIAQAQARGLALRDRLNEEVNAGTKTRDQALAEFDAYWGPNVAVPRQQLEADRARQAYTDSVAVQQENQRRTDAAQAYEERRLTAGRTAGQDAVSRAQATLPYMVGPTFAEDFSKALGTLSSGGGAVSFKPESFMFDMPDLDKLAAEASAAAIARMGPYVSGPALPPPPTAADLDAVLGPIGQRPALPWGAPAASPAAPPPQQPWRYGVG